LAAAFRTALPVRIDFWDGSSLGPRDSTFALRFTRRRALRRNMWSPNELGFVRAYVSGDLEIDGDLMEAMSTLTDFAHSGQGPVITIDAATTAAIARAALTVGAVGPPPGRPAEEAQLGGHLHSRRRDAEAISHHYDVGNDFYQIVLGPSLVYSCAYYEEEPGATYGLDEAQHSKLDHVARKLGLHEGMRVLDVGCGWGSFVIHAARAYGVQAVGVTLSAEQAALARNRVLEEGLEDLVEIRVQDYRDITDGPFDAIASIGMAEHVGFTQLPAYASALYNLLAPNGRLLNHAISRRPGPRHTKPDEASLIWRYVFPDGELNPLSDMIDVLETAGFEVRDVESLREHYGRTLRAWVANLETQWDEAVRLTTPGRARVWRLYMAGSALGFEANWVGVSQVLAVRTPPTGESMMPPTRATFA
ncbi:MAG: class I SAM-dependent methyltransferase, partial [Arachnia sp.]